MLNKLEKFMSKKIMLKWKTGHDEKKWCVIFYSEWCQPNHESVTWKLMDCDWEELWLNVEADPVAISKIYEGKENEL